MTDHYDDPRVRAELAVTELRKSVIDVSQNAALVMADIDLKSDVHSAIGALMVLMNRANKDAA